MDRRTSPRAACALYLNEVDDRRVALCRAINISEGGVYLRRLTGGALLEGETVRLEMALPGEDALIWASARVVQQVEEVLYDAAAVKFVSLTSGDRRRIGEYVTDVRRARMRNALSGLCRA